MTRHPPRSTLPRGSACPSAPPVLVGRAGSGLPDVVTPRPETVDEELPPLLGVDLPVPVEVFADPDRDEAEIALGFSARLGIAVEHVQEHARRLRRGRLAGRPH